MKKLLLSLPLLFGGMNAMSQCTDLFFSEYVEGSSNNKALEIYNPTSAPINLASYSIKTYFNGSPTAGSTLALTGTINPGDVYVIAHSSSVASLLASADFTFSGGVVNFNGDDAIELLNGTTVIDVIGTVGVDPGAGWTINGIADAGQNHTLRRLQARQLGNTTWAGSGENEWTIYNQDVFTYIGSHIMNSCGSTLSATYSPINDTICLGTTIATMASGLGGSAPYTYFWEFGDGTAPVMSGSTMHTYSATGTYNITYAVYDGAMNVYSFTFPIVVVAAPAEPTIDSIGPFCTLGVPTNLTADISGGVWSGPGIIDGSLGTFDASAAGAGTHSIVYTIFGACDVDDTLSIDVFESTSPNILTGDSTICNDVFGIFIYADAGGTWSGFNVNDNGGGEGFFSSPAITPGTYYAVYTTPTVCGAADSIAITVIDYPVPSFTFSSSMATVNFTNTTSGTGLIYSWDFGDGNTSTTTSPSYTFTANGTYNVCLTAYNGVCEGVTCQSVNITGLGINENSSDLLQIFPNPNNGNFTLSGSSTILQITLCDASGKTISSFQPNSTSTQMNLTEIENGFYFIRVKTNNGESVRKIEIIK
jgi:PKD repeat protein